MEEKEVQLQSVPQKNLPPSSLNESTVSRVIRTEMDEQRGLMGAPRDKNSKVTVAKVIKFLLTIGVVIVALALMWQRPDGQASAAATKVYREGVVELNQTTSKKFAWLRQKLDHFSPSDQRTFYQRVFINTEGSSLKGAQPVFLYVPGLSPFVTVQASNFMEKQAKERKGISLAIETRYFGESSPFEDSYSLENLKYLSMQQIVEDIAYAIHRIIDNRFFGITERNQWVINGGHIGGTLAAWVRAKYPSLTVGAIASSPYLPIPLTPLTSERIYEKVESAGKKCRVIIDKLRQNLEEELADDRRQALLYSIGQGVELTPDEILYFYQKRLDMLKKESLIQICHPTPETELLTKLRKVILGQSSSPYDPLTYSQRALASVDDWRYFEVVRTARAGWYVRCTQAGPFQISTKRSFSPPRINEAFFRQRCKNIFGADLWPDPKPLMDQYSPYLSSATNLLVVHGYYDTKLPYALNVSSPRSETIIEKCLQCEELFDFSPLTVRYEAIEEALGKQREALDRWLKKS